jgi:DNA replication protein DnaC
LDPDRCYDPGFGPSSTGNHIAAARQRASTTATGYFSQTTDIVQRLQPARRDLRLAAARQLDQFDLIVLDDLSYVRKDRPDLGAVQPDQPSRAAQR